MASPLLFMLCTAAVLVSFIPYGIFQEAITSHKDESGQKFRFPTTLLVVQVVFHVLASWLATKILREDSRTIPMREAWMPGFTFVGAMFCSSLALKYVSYPTQALAKSSKMIPVMIGGFLFRSESYSLLQYLQVAMVTIGITIFQWKSGGSKNENLYGVTLLLLSLLLDGLTGPNQKQITHRTKCTSFQLMFACNVWALLLLIVALVIPEYGEGLDGFYYMLEPKNTNLLMDVLSFAACSALGSSAIFFTLRALGPLRLTLITTTRKFFTIFASVVIFGHHLSMVQWIAVCLVLSGVALELLEASAKGPVAGAAEGSSSHGVDGKDKKKD